MNNNSMDISSSSNLTGNFIQGDVKGDVKAYIGSESKNQSKTLAEAAQEIQALLDQLSKNYSSSSPTNDLKIATKTIEKIESNPNLKSRVINALKSGGTEALKELINHPSVNVLMASIEGWNS